MLSGQVVGLAEVLIQGSDNSSLGGINHRNRVAQVVGYVQVAVKGVEDYTPRPITHGYRAENGEQSGGTISLDGSHLIVIGVGYPHYIVQLIVSNAIGRRDTGL